MDIQREIAKTRLAARQNDMLNSTQPLTTNINEKISQKSQRQNLINQKGAAPITDIRAKRQAATLNVEDLPN
jgi:hypothetical protein